MLVVADSHIPGLQGLIEPHAAVAYRDTITAADAHRADVLLVRTRTRCDAALLDGSSVQMIGTATIGTDHIDLAYCRSRGIDVVSAPGCNAPAVAQWVLATVAQWMLAQGITHTGGITLGIVGVGHVGSIVDRWARQAGLSTLLCDPPRAEAGHNGNFVPLEHLAEHSDVITLHTPLTRSGKWPTWHLCDTQLLHRATRCRLLLNAARGAVCDTQALLRWTGGDLAIDCWENEPGISPELLKRAFVATPHIAGYSLQGKQRATAAMLDALSNRFGWPIDFARPPAGDTSCLSLADIAATYDPLADTAALRSMPEQFEALRNHYALRNEPGYASLR